MSIKRHRAYFTTEQADAIVANLKASMGEAVPSDEVLAAVRAYLASPKHQYENSLLSGVIDGSFDLALSGDRFVWTVRRPEAGGPPGDRRSADLQTTE
jgi:hypothetical protein